MQSFRVAAVQMEIAAHDPGRNLTDARSWAARAAAAGADLVVFPELATTGPIEHRVDLIDDQRRTHDPAGGGRRATGRGARILVSATARPRGRPLTERRGHSRGRPSVSRASENSMAVLFANAAGECIPCDPEFPKRLFGHSQLAMPFLGAVQRLESAAEAMLIADVDLGLLADAVDLYGLGTMRR